MGQVSAKLRDLKDGVLCFWCPGCLGMHCVNTETRPRWGYNGNPERPTFTPSIAAWSEAKTETDPETGEWHWPRDAAGNTIAWRCHSFVTDGQIQFLSDCTHALAGQTVPLPDLPPYLRDPSPPLTTPSIPEVPGAAGDPRIPQRSTPMNPNIGNIFDKYVKPEWLDLVHAAEGKVDPALTDAAKAAVAKAQADAQAAQTAAEAAAAQAESSSASAENSVQAAVDGVVVPALNDAIGAVAGSNPLFGFLASEGEQVLDPLAIKGLNALIAKAQSFLPAGL